MIKSQEFTGHGCLAKAENSEMLFILLARDPAAPATIRFWIEERQRRGLNSAVTRDTQMTEAEKCAKTMELQRQFPDKYMPEWAERKRTELEKALERR